MMKFNLCSNEASCEKICMENNGSINFIKNKNESIHSLEKKYEISKDTCTASFAIKEICIAFSLQSESNNISKIEGGCYDGNYFIYDFESKVIEANIVLREKEDPVLAAIAYSNNYNPYIVK